MSFDENNDRVQHLAFLKLNGKITADEDKELAEWLDLLPEEEITIVGSRELLKSRIMAGIQKRINPRIPVRKKMYRYAVAASFITFALVGGFFVYHSNKKSPPTDKEYVLNDIAAPKINRATIKMADGKIIYLDSSNKGTLASIGNVSLQKLADGTVVYAGTNKQVTYNLLTNPKGSNVIDLVLSDGTKVWLNAGSSLEYPVSFTEKDRKVKVTGEAYFEVAHNALKPFRVLNGETEVAVLGTHFNVKAYENDADIKVTLIEGSVRVSKGAMLKVIRPGQQAIVESGNIALQDNADIETVLAWKNGYFHFDKTSITEIMKEVSRWYNVDVEFDKSYESRRFSGEIARDANLSQLLKIMNESNVNCSIEGKKLIVK